MAVVTKLVAKVRARMSAASDLPFSSDLRPLSERRAHVPVERCVSLVCLGASLFLGLAVLTDGKFDLVARENGILSPNWLKDRIEASERLNTAGMLH